MALCPRAHACGASRSSRFFMTLLNSYRRCAYYTAAHQSATDSKPARATGGTSRVRSLHRQTDALHVNTDSSCDQATLGGDTQLSRAQAAGHRTRRGRWLRREAEFLPRGIALRLPHAEAASARQVDRVA